MAKNNAGDADSVNVVSHGSTLSFTANNFCICTRSKRSFEVGVRTLTCCILLDISTAAQGRHEKSQIQLQNLCYPSCQQAYYHEINGFITSNSLCQILHLPVDGSLIVCVSLIAVS